jgi:hypothetical protein
LLGMYLGDGCISRTRRTYVLRIFLHRKQVDVIARVYRAIRSLLPDHRVGYVPRRHDASITITSYFNGWPDLLPQHGSGRKHARAIILEPWQAEIVERHSDQFVRGLIESDGCRHRRIVARKRLSGVLVQESLARYSKPLHVGVPSSRSPSLPGKRGHDFHRSTCRRGSAGRADGRHGRGR